MGVETIGGLPPQEIGGVLDMLRSGATVVLVLVGCFFFLAGTVGLLRFPDVYCRLHALTKADNLGLGCIVAGLALQAESGAERAQLVLTWLVAVTAAATVCHLLARFSLRAGVRPIEGPIEGPLGRSDREATP